MSSERPTSLKLTQAEIDFLLTLLSARPPASDAAHGEWTSSDAIDDWSEDEYREAWVALDDKLRSGDLGGGEDAAGS